MSKKIQLSIAEPCHENWENMNPVEKGKFCGSCQKQVVDFSHMSDRQVAEFFKKPSTGSVCGRFMTDQLHRDIEIPKKRIPWVKYFFTIAVPAFFISKASAQDISKAKPSTDTTKAPIPDRITLGLVMPKLVEKPVCKDTTEQVVKGEIKLVEATPVKGQVKSEYGDAIPGASVIIKGTTNGVVTGNDGSFSLIPDKNWSKIILSITGIGLEPKEMMVDRNNYKANSIINIGVAYVQNAIMGKIAVSTTVKKAECTIEIPEVLKDADTKTFKAFPNPVVSGTNLTIEWKQKKEGYYALQLVNLSGQNVYRQEIWIDAKSRSVSTDVPFVSAGNYFLVLTNKKTGKKYSEKIVIQ
jgi:hypothetical protein